MLKTDPSSRVNATFQHWIPKLKENKEERIEKEKEMDNEWTAERSSIATCLQEGIPVY